jgi:RND family efflux transporter MFP subunit
MPPISKLHGLALGLAATVLVPSPSTAQAPATAGGARSPGDTIVVVGQIDWLDKSDITALREGVIKQIEYQTGDRVEVGKPIGSLHDESARLAVAKAEVAANSTGAIERAKASESIAKTRLAISYNLLRLNANNVTPEQIKMEEAELLAARASIQEATEQQNLAKAELAIARQLLDEHTIIAPFTGYVTERMKAPAESVRASEPVLRLVRTDKLRFFGYVPLESAQRVHEGDIVEVRPVIEDAELPVEAMRFKGKVVNLTREVSTIGRTEIQVLAEIDNPADGAGTIGQELLRGMKGEMTIQVGSAPARASAPAAPTAVGSRDAGLPALPSTR